MAKTRRDELEECFNAIPKDGRNISDEDDNGYASLNADTSIPFDNKASEMLDIVATVSPVMALPRTEVEELPKVVEPAPKPEPVVQKKTETVVEKAPANPELMDELLSVSDELTLSDAPNKPATVEVKPPVQEVVEMKPRKEVSADALFGEMDEIMGTKTTINAPSKTNDVVEVKEEKTPEKTEQNDTPFKEEVKSVDTEISPDSNSLKMTVAHQDAKADVNEGWMLETDVKHHERLYAYKARAFRSIMSGGPIPFKKLSAELENMQPKVTCSYDLRNMYEQMVEIVAMKERATEIKIRLNKQLFRWKRWMDMLRAEASITENTKVAERDAAALRHLRDFEDYNTELENLEDTAEGVMKNLESAWDTLNRGVTIVLQSQGHDRGMTRYESPTYGGPPTQTSGQNNSSRNDDLFDFDGVAQPTPKKVTGEGWDSVQ